MARNFVAVVHDSHHERRSESSAQPDRDPPQRCAAGRRVRGDRPGDGQASLPPRGHPCWPESGRRGRTGVRLVNQANEHAIREPAPRSTSS